MRSKENPLGSRPPLEPYYIYVLIVILSLLTADLIVLSQRAQMLPEQGAQMRPALASQNNVKDTNYSMVTRKNVFNRSGEVPAAIGAPETPDGKMPENDPVPSQLPIVLVGTIVHANEARSIATVQLTSANKIAPFIKDDDIEGLATMVRVERGKIIFRNNNNNMLEYVELPKDEAMQFGAAQNKPAAVATGPGDVQTTGSNEFTLTRDVINKYTKDLPAMLQQARAVPVLKAGGQIDGFRIVDYAADSIYEKLGLKRGDVIKGVNGDPVDSPAKGMALYSSLKSADEIKLELERNGRLETFTYRIR